MKVRDLLERKQPAGVVTVAPTTDAVSAARLLMQHTIGGMPVVAQDGTLVGFLAERDFVRSLLLHPSGAPDARVEHMMRAPAPVCDADEQVAEVTARMTRERLRHLVVLDGSRIIGILSVGDLVKRRMEELELEAGVLRDYVVAQRSRG